MDEHALAVLEFGELLTLIAGYAGTESGRDLVLELRPCRDLVAAQARHDLYAELLALLEAGVSLPQLRFRDATEVLRRVSPEDAVLDGQELILCRDLLLAVAQLGAFLGRDECRGHGQLLQLRRTLTPSADLLEALTRSLDDRGELLDSASPLLAQLRRRGHSLAECIEERLHTFLRDPGLETALRDRFVTVRNGRFVIPVRREAKGRVPGGIHDHSDSGKTVFIEPAETLGLGNDLADTRLEERDECRRLLAELSQQVRLRVASLRQDQWVLAQFDAGAAVAAWADDYACHLPRFTQGLRLCRARHPLLERQFRLDGGSKRVIPLDLELPHRAGIMVITGSNSGGKTVTLKTVGLLALAAQAGLPVPAAEDSEFSVFEQVFADIGDEQSLEQNLSTFSGHMSRLTGILRSLNRDRALVLLDELGAGTDPLEGGALACAILSELAEAGARVVATTHLGAVKTFVHDQPGMVNAAVRFNPKTLEPEYVLEVGRPGASHALSIAARFGVPEAVLERAHRLLHTDHLRLERMLGELEEAQQRLTVRERETKSALEHMVRDRDQLREELHGLRAERKRLLHEAYAQAAQTVENTRRQMERLLREVERSVASPARKQVSAQARDEVQTRQAKIEQALIETAARPRVPIRPAALRRGQKVWVEKLRANGRIVSLSPGQDLATVQVGGIRFSVALREIGEPDAGQTPAETSEAKLSMPRPQAAVASELNLVGNRVDVALGRLDTFLDQALLAKLPEVRVIHGFGTGRLREAVHACLREHPAACRFRLGRQGQDPGGAGATIVRLAEPAPR